MNLRFKEISKILDVAIVCLGGFASVGTMIYAIFHFGLSESWPELVLNIFYLACLVMIVMYLFNYKITTKQFNYWCTLCIAITVLLRDILFPAPISYYSIRLSGLTLSVLLLCMLTFFYARKDWESYTKGNLWMIFVVDTLIAILANLAIYLEPTSEYTEYFFTEIWIRPTITYGLVACFISEKKKKNE